ncbi:sodium-coupled monocarboxylate transporter 1-like [Periplaneta americana]|uniref:sodium-coupled monocarboxylate transporter 1-like n=1 Tax=Periplaneta americana TaxID=6978 RepID=UPI0037E9320F
MGDMTDDATRHLYFGWLDFSLFGLMLGFSALIGVYFGCCEKKLESRVDYLFGGKNLKILPVAVSLVASHFSGITLMGVPSEVFYYGSLYWLVNVSSTIVTVIINYIYLPLFYRLQLTSTYEYLQLRFNRSVRVMASFLFTVSVLLYIPIVIYVPALAFSYVSGVSMHFITPLVCIICIFYTMLGGLKAVVWIDFLQSFVIMVSSIAIIVLGLIYAGGFGRVWNAGVEGGRVDLFVMDPSPLIRATFWSVIIGNIFSWLNYCAVNQGMVQKFLALPSLNHAKQALLLFTLGIFIIKTISCFTGLIIYATYMDCDPLKSKAIQRQDQLVPYYIMDTAASIPGLPGLFVAGVFSAALSSMASNMNSLAGTMYEDFIQPCLRRKVSEKIASYILRIMVFIIGAICVFMVFIVEKLGGILQLAYATGGVTSGAFLGLFSLGIFFPRANSKGALAGAITSMLALAWIVVGTQKSYATGTLKHVPLPTTADGCSASNVTLTTTTTTAIPIELPDSSAPEEPFILYRISFMYYTMLGTIILIVVGLIVSYFTEQPDPDMNPDLFAPFIRDRILAKKKVTDKEQEAETELLNNSNNRKMSNSKVEGSAM